MDLTVVAIPAFFGGMGAEYWQLKRTAAERGLTPGDYERSDTIASLTMGTASLLAPIVMGKVMAPITPGKGRFGKALVATAVTAAVVTTVADVLARKGDGPLGPAGVVPPSRRDAADASSGAVAEQVDLVGRHQDGVPAAPPSRAQRRLRDRARRVASSAGVAAVVAGGTAITTTWANKTTGRKLFEKRPGPDLGTGPLAVAGAILAWDFLYYWNHRFAHESRYAWAVHVVHHSSEHYNLSTALRQPVADTFSATIPFGVLGFLGFRPEVIETARGVNLLYQFWVHTETIQSLGKAEEVLNSPSAHRVHHGSNKQYLDRNHGGIFIIWDRLFGTHELEDEPVVYGLTRNIDTFNPLAIASHEHRDILRDVASSTTWRDRLSYVVRGPGWAYSRRAETEAVAEALPVELPEPVAAGVA